MRNARLEMVIARQTEYLVKDILAGALMVTGMVVGLLSFF